MAALTLGGSSTLLRIPDDFSFGFLNNYTSNVRNPTLFAAVVQDAGGPAFTLEAQGSGFSYILGRLVGGTINSIQVNLAGALDWSIVGLNLNAAAFEQQLLVVGNNASAATVLLDGNDSFLGNAAGTLFRGFNGNDTFRPLQGNDTVDGGAGIDTYVTGVLRLETQITGTPISGGTVTGPEGVDTLTAVERIAFVDGTLAFSTETTAAQVDRLYIATLGREADAIGEARWVAGIEAGALSLQSVAASLTGSGEFVGRYGALSTAGFVDLLYQNVLGRTPDASGRAAWINGIDAGGLSRATVTLGFSESAEFKASTAFAVDQGLFVLDLASVTTYSAYVIGLGRPVDAAGAAQFVNALKNGAPAQLVYQGVAGSGEFASRFGALSAAAKLDVLYDHAFGRDADAGAAGFLPLVQAGPAGIAQVIEALAGSAEFGNRLNTEISDGILFA